MKYTIISIIFLMSSTLWATMPPKKGVVVSPQTWAALVDISKGYGEGSLVEVMRNWAARKMRGEAVQPTEFQFPVLVGKYSDSGDDQWDVSLLQQELFDGPWPTGTMREMYIEQSYGQFLLDGTVSGWYRTSQPAAWYENGENGLPWRGGRAPEFVKELVALADDSIDFGQYDNDNDGWVESVFIVHYGYGGESGTPGIWSHRTRLSRYVGAYATNDTNALGINVYVNDYIMQPALSGNSGNDLIEIGVFCHEFGHAVGLPDLYDSDGSSAGIGEWGLMGSGSWGGDGSHPEYPTHMGAWSKEQLGWVTPTVLDVNEVGSTFYAAEDTGVVYKLWKDGNITPRVSQYGAGLDVGEQYFLVEYRARKKFDRFIHNSGLAVWHIDNTVTTGNRNDLHRLVDLEEADGAMSGRGDPGDVFPGSAGVRRFDDTTDPDSRGYAGGVTNVGVWRISDPDSVMTANLDVSPRPHLSAALLYSVDDAANDPIDRVEPGETGSLYAVVINELAGAADTAFITLRTDEPGITIDDTMKAFSIGGNSTTEVDVPFSVDAGFSPARMVEFDAVFRTGGYEFVSTGLRIPVGFPGILVTDADRSGSDYGFYFTETLDSLGENYELWKTASGLPNLVYNRDVLIWFTGDGDSLTVSQEEQDSLIAYLDWGGKLFITGKDIGNDIGVTDFYHDYLHASRAGETGSVVMTGAVGSFTDGMLVGVTGIGGARNQGNAMDVLTTDSLPGTHILFENSDGVTGIGYAGDYNLVYFGFGFEAVTAPNPVLTSRDTLLTAILDWLETAVGVEGERLASPLTFNLDQNHPNPFNPVTEIAYSLPAAGHTKLMIYNILGEEVARPVDGFQLPGRHRVRWDAGDVASGVYFYRLQAGDFSRTRKMVVLR